MFLLIRVVRNGDLKQGQRNVNFLINGYKNVGTQIYGFLGKRVHFNELKSRWSHMNIEGEGMRRESLVR